ncbi:hypothetical protein BDV25DRAFT_129413 [Aspergillus avenaceus]|uniref:Uncharacterized protein n=1 Tax=Aspergillus avenaceus TaxID=36643 RepID=A0A5N6TW88_ASPAV|nr:hypothetical protein BDV25DRAFT_129413 [Aspergillus avenaceus]
MALSHSFWLGWSVIYIYLGGLVAAVPWIVTDFYEQAVVTESYYYTTEVKTTIQHITPTATALPEAVSTITSLNTGYYETDVTVIEKLYPTGAGTPANRYGYYNGADGGSHLTVFKVNLTYSAPTGCSTQWTQTTAAEISPPRVVQKLLPQTATTTSISVDTSRPFQPTTHTYDVVYVDPTQIPSSSLEYLSRHNRPTSRYTGDDCYYTGSSGSYYHYSSFHESEKGWFLDDYYMGISPLALTLIVSITWIGLLLILGFVEAFIRFRRLMTGWQTRRGLPVCWSLTIMPFTLFLLCYFRKGYRARSEADAEVLRRRWKAMSMGTKLRLFFVWGFRFQYPPMLGPAPARVKTSKQPGNNPGPRLLPPSPSTSVTSASRPGSSADPEMAQPGAGRPI